MKPGYKKKIARDTMIGGIVGGIAVTAFSYWTGYNIGEHICDWIPVYNSYVRGTIDITLMSQLGLYGTPAGLSIGAGIGAAVSAVARCGRFGRQVLEDMLREEEQRLNKK